MLGWSHGASTLMALLASSNTWTSSGQTQTGTAPLYNTGKAFKVGYAFYAGCGLETRDAGDGHSFDEAFSVGGLFTQKHVDAKATYDLQALDFFESHLQ